MTLSDTLQIAEDRKAEILRDYHIGNLTKLGVANSLRQAGFTSGYAVDLANELPDGPKHISDASLMLKLQSIIEDIGPQFPSDRGLKERLREVLIALRHRHSTGITASFFKELPKIEHRCAIQDAVHRAIVTAKFFNMDFIFNVADQTLIASPNSTSAHLLGTFYENKTKVVT